MGRIFDKLVGPLPPCAFHELTGLYCPGCGGTRAVRFLVRGNIEKSFIYNPVVLYTVIATFIFFFFVVKYKIGGRHLNKDKLILPMLYIGVFIIVLSCLLSACFILFFRIHLLK